MSINQSATRLSLEQRLNRALDHALTLMRAGDPALPRPRVLLSACLAGEPVRYDGRDKHLGRVLTQLQPYLQFETFCPEMAAGMGVPRPPIQWVMTASGEQQLQQVDKPESRAEESLEVAVAHFIETRPQPLSAILKARSPSCGAGSAVLLSEQGEPVGQIDGLFTAALRAANPQLAIIDENYFDSSEAVYWFVLGHYLAISHTHAAPIRSLWPGTLSGFLLVDKTTRQQQLLALMKAGKS